VTTGVDIEPDARAGAWGDPTRTRILYLTHHLPWPARSGGTVREYQLLARLRRDFDVGLLAVGRGPVPAPCTASNPLGLGSVEVHADESRRTTRRQRHSRRTRAALTVAAGRGAAEVIHVEGGYLFHLVPEGLRGRVCLVEHNIESQVLRQFARISGDRRLLRTSHRVAQLEERAWRGAAAVVAVTSEDREQIARRSHRTDVRLVPNGSDHLPAGRLVAPAAAAQPRAVFLANYAYAPNDDALRWLLAEIWPAVVGALPDAQLVLAGSGMSVGQRRLAAAAARVSVRGTVDDVASVLDGADVLVAPLRAGGGVKVKVLEALRRGCPVVTTPVGAQGIHGPARDVLRVADDARGIAAAVLGVLGGRAGAARCPPGRTPRRRRRPCGARSPPAMGDRESTGSGAATGPAVATDTAPVVPYSPIGTTYGPAELAALTECLTSARTLSCGEQRDAFEQEFARYLGVDHAISVANCTVALELATYLCDLRPGDEVIATAQSYQATVTPLLCGPATVRFCDIEPETLTIDPVAIEQLLTDRTRAVFLVHYGGDMADMEAITALTADRGIVVVEDCAHALGAQRAGARPGVRGSLGCFSFQSYKNISTLGEGGMITTNDAGWARRLRRLRSIEPDASYVPRVRARIGDYDAPADGVFRHEKEAYTADCVEIRHPGTNSTLAEPAAAVGRVQLRRIDELVAARKAIADVLDATLRSLPGVRVQERPAGAVPAHHLYTFFVGPSARVAQPELLGLLRRQGIEVQQRYFPLHLLAEWRLRGNGLGLCPVTEDLWFHQMVNLPIYPQLTTGQLDHMVEVLIRTLGR
jgi:perosamine synthetase